MTTSSTALTLQPSQLAMAISNPGALGTIDAYISTVNRLPMLSAEQESLLARRLRDDADIAAARELGGEAQLLSTVPGRLNFRLALAY